MACMGSLCTIAKSRPEFMQRVVAAQEALNSNLPPTLTPSQVSSVKKHMKLQLMNILRNPCSYEVQPNLISLLTTLGVTSQEIARATPKIDEQLRKKLAMKRVIEPLPSTLATKRARLDNDIDRDVEMEEPDRQKSEAFKLNEQFVFERLNPDTVTQLVISAMQHLPNTMPSHFSNNYSPVANAGRAVQCRNLAKLLAAQFVEAGVGPGCTAGASQKDVRPKVAMPPEEAVVKAPKKEIVDPAFEDIKRPLVKAKDDEKSRKVRVKTLRLEQITKPINLDVRENMLIKSVKRILRAEPAAMRAGANILRSKIITTLACTFGSGVREAILLFILEDMKSQMDIALAWLYEEYSYLQGFNRITTMSRHEKKPDHSYNTLLCALLSHLDVETRDRDLLLTRIFLEAPLITEEAVEFLKHICVQETRAASTMSLLHELVFRRPTKYLTFINVLLHHTAHENHVVREEAISHVLQLYNDREDIQSIIKEQAIVYLGFLTQSQPPPILFGDDRGRPKVLDNWNDEACKACLYLYLALLPIKETLIHELSRIYTQTTADIKRTILRLLEQPVRGMGMDSPELLTLVESCPKGAETLVTRVIHILTDRGPPSAVLVAKVRELYQTRVSDVRFLIPVLNGLTKKEIIAALPKLIKLNPVVVKEVFNRLLAGHSDGPITPADLLIALHVIDVSKADLKTVMKATSLCFAEKTIYTQEVLAVVMQQLMDVTPLPTLLMRTVIQSLALYPRLSGFVMNILQRLILKQVWKQKVVWEGFIKCCQRTKPQSFQVLLQLPSAQLTEALVICPELRAPLLEHVNTFTETQRAHLPSWVMDVLTGRTASADTEVRHKTMEPPEVLPTEPLPPGMD